MNDIRPDYRSVNLLVDADDGLVTVGLCEVEGECPFHTDCEVVRDQPIKLRGKAVATDENGSRFVDLEAAEWGCVRP